MATPQQVVHRGIVKQVLSGDSLIIRGQPRGGPPPERTVGLSNIQAPRLARRPNPGLDASLETKDEPYAWEAREFLRKKIIGKEVLFTVEYKVPGTGKEFGHVFLGKEGDMENVTEALVAEGLVELRRMGLKASDEAHQRLMQMEEAAKTAGKGKWNETNPQEHVRDIKWSVDNLSHFVDSHHGKPIEAVIEHVRDGCTVRAYLLPSFHYVTVMLSGVKCPMFKIEEDGKQTPEQFAEEAKFFTESRLLNRDVTIVLEGVSNQNFLGTVLHPNGNITELLLKEGFARCADWSMGVVSQGPEKLRGAEKFAKEKKLRIWKDYQPSDLGMDIKDKNYTAKVVEVVNGDGLMVKMGDGTIKKIFLASIRSPRQADVGEDSKKKDPKYRPRPLYDIPYMFEAREFLRKKLIGKKVNVQVDYIQPKSDDFPEKTCCTVTISNSNVAEALVGRGLAKVVRYRQDDDKRSAFYDKLLAAEERAKKKNAGVHSKKQSPMIRVADVSGDVQKAKQFLPFLQRAGRCEAVAEFVASGSRIRLYIPRETCLITFLLAGIDCPRGSRPAPDRITRIPADPYGEEAMEFTKDLVLQKEVEVEVESMDKGGNFIGWLFIDGINLSVQLVEEGLAKVHFTAERSNHFKQLTDGEAKAKKEKLYIWSSYEEPKEIIPENEPQERKVNYKKVCITEITNEGQFYAQNVEEGPQLETLMDKLRADLTASPPTPGAYQPRKNDLCAARFSDGEWYRAKVEKVANNKAHVLYIDYGNREDLEYTRMAALPPTYATLSPQAHRYSLACTQNPPEPEDIQNAVDHLYNDILNKECLLNVEYGSDHVTLLFPDTKEDVAQSLIAQGVLLAESRREQRLAKLVANYQKAQDKAKAARLNVWRYGDFTSDDAKEFGYQP